MHDQLIIRWRLSPTYLATSLTFAGTFAGTPNLRSSTCVCGSGTDAKLLSRRLLTNTCTDRSPSFGQCGGLTCSDGSGSHCSDAAYKCCPSDNTCQRQNQWYWQCLPKSPSSGTNSAAPTETPFVPNSELLFTAGPDPAVPGCKFCLEA